MANQILKGIGKDRIRAAGLEASLDHTMVGAISHENECFGIGHVRDVRRGQESGEGFTEPTLGPNLYVRMLNRLMQVSGKLGDCGPKRPLAVKVNALEQMYFHRWLLLSWNLDSPIFQFLAQPPVDLHRTRG